MITSLTDNFARKFYYLRLSITDVCNFRCRYCLPNGYQQEQKKSFLSLTEINRVTTAFTALGVQKIRLTGGEPTLRKDFTDIVTTIRQKMPTGIIAVTTNGYRLKQDVKQWKQAGLDIINVSVDSLDPNYFQLITKNNQLADILSGIDEAFSVGYPTIKVNTVLMRHFNAHTLPQYLDWIKHYPIQLRFIELMETEHGREFFQQHFVSALTIEQLLLQQGWQKRQSKKTDGPAQIYFHPDYQGEIGLIMPYSKNFCAQCNRLRVSSIGKLHMCLFGDESQGIDLRDLLSTNEQFEQLKIRILQSLANKQEKHLLPTGNVGITKNLSFIGG